MIIFQSYCLTVLAFVFLLTSGFCFAALHSHRGVRVLDEGLATVWNAKNPSRVIVAGDRILEVNGESMSPEDWKRMLIPGRMLTCSADVLFV